MSDKIETKMSIDKGLLSYDSNKERLNTLVPGKVLEFDYSDYRKKSYSQEGEDGILMRIFEFHPKGYYVDIGAHHPLRFSNTYKFYELGWRGINVDAMPGSMYEFNVIRPFDINLEIAVSDKEENIPFYVFNEPALNTFSESVANERNGISHYKIDQVINLKTRTLESILDEYLPENQPIDFLNIDAEGLDLEILLSNNWNKYRPKIILIESEIDLSSLQNSELNKIMVANNYSFYAKTVKTFFFKENTFNI